MPRIPLPSIYRIPIGKVQNGFIATASGLSPQDQTKPSTLNDRGARPLKKNSLSLRFNCTITVGQSAADKVTEISAIIWTPRFVAKLVSCVIAAGDFFSSRFLDNCRVP